MRNGAEGYGDVTPPPTTYKNQRKEARKPAKQQEKRKTKRGKRGG
jgi:hypothetical protein